MMANEGMPTCGYGDTGEYVSQAQRALRRTPDTALAVDGIFGPKTEVSTKRFQQSAGLPPTGTVDEATWKALPDGNPMPILKEGAKGDVVRALQTALTMGAFGLWEEPPQGVDGMFGADTTASGRGFLGGVRRLGFPNGGGRAAPAPGLGRVGLPPLPADRRPPVRGNGCRDGGGGRGAWEVLAGAPLAVPEPGPARPALPHRRPGRTGPRRRGDRRRPGDAPVLRSGARRLPRRDAQRRQRDADVLRQRVAAPRRVRAA